MTRMPPKSLARVLGTIACREPGEHGLFWDPDGSMPWKEFYWALQEEPDLKHVRETHIREILYLGIDLPFTLDGPLIRLGATEPHPSYPEAVSLPPRLYFGGKRHAYDTLKEQGLRPRGRPFVRLTADAALAVRIAKRRDPTPFRLEVDTKLALQMGSRFLSAGGGLFLAPSVPAEALILPLLKQEERRETSAAAQRGNKRPSAATPGAGAGFQAGTFPVGAHHLARASGGSSPGAKKEPKGGPGSGWKRSSRKERHKRDA